MKKQPEPIAVIKNSLTEQEMKESGEHWAAHKGPYMTIAETLVYAAERDKLTKQSAVQTLRWENEMAWAADRVERDRDPAPLDAVHLTDPADVPTDLTPVWLLPTVHLNQTTEDPCQDALLSEINSRT